MSKTETIKVTLPKESKGHQANTHKVHVDKRTKRVRTRSAKNRQAINNN